MTRDDEPPPCEFRKRLLRIIEIRQPQFRSITDLGLQADLAKGTLSNGLLKAEELGVEPVFETESVRKVAGVARVSLSWLLGEGKNENADDIPDPPAVTPLELARRRAGGANAEMLRLRAEVKRLQAENKRLQKATQKN